MSFLQRFLPKKKARNQKQGSKILPKHDLVRSFGEQSILAVCVGNSDRSGNQSESSFSARTSSAIIKWFKGNCGKKLHPKFCMNPNSGVYRRCNVVQCVQCLRELLQCLSGLGAVIHQAPAKLTNV